MIGQTVSRYKILKKLGEGGMGEVFLADDMELKRKVALKFLGSHYMTDSEALARFKREAQSAAALNHPNIVTIYEVSSYKGRPFIAMEWIDGRSLRELIAEDLTTARALEIAAGIAAGLSGAHSAEVIHRDIKPDNILIGTDGRVRILDFGLAKLRGGTSITKESSTMGTIRYMSPEQTQGSDVDHRSDLFSLGAVLYEMLAGRPPFAGDHPSALIYAINSAEPQPVGRYNSSVSTELERVVSKCLAKSTDERYQSANDLLADIRRELHSMGTSPTTPPVAIRASRTRRFAAPGVVLLIVILALLVFKPFHVNIEVDAPANASENLLAIMYFDNIQDPADSKRLGEMIMALLITDLSESQSLKVLSHQRLFDILKMRGDEGLKTIDRTTATDVATDAGARWMLLGSIVQTSPTMVVTSQLVNVATGEVESSQRANGKEGDNVFVVVDKLAAGIRTDLVLPARAVSSGHTQEVASRSEEAYRLYLEGVEAFYRYDRPAAAERLQRAVEVDSTLAIAMARLTEPAMPGSPEEKRRYASAALRHIDRGSHRDRYFIRAAGRTWLDNDIQGAVAEFEALLERYPDDKEAMDVVATILANVLNENTRAIAYLERAIEIDPLFETAYNRLAYAYNNTGDHDRAIWAINKYIELAPEEWNPYDSRGELYAAAGKLDEAMASFKTALEKKPDFGYALIHLGEVYLFKRDYAEAARYGREVLAGQPNPRMHSFGRAFQAAIPLYQGKMTEGLATLEKSIAADDTARYTGLGYGAKLTLLVDLHLRRGDYQSALEAARVLADTNADPEQAALFGQHNMVCVMARSGDIEGAEALMREIDEAAQSNPSLELSRRLAQAHVAQAKAEYDVAVGHMEYTWNETHAFWVACALGELYIKAGEISRAVGTLERKLRDFSDFRSFTPVESVRINYLMGLAYEASGWNEKAVEQYEEFLEIWKDADPGIAEVDDARARLARLKQGS